MESEPGSMTGAARRVLLAALVLNVVDAILHIVTGQVEAPRILSNAILIALTGALLARPDWARAAACLTAAGVYLALNLWSVAARGIGGLGVFFIAASTLLMILAAGLLWRIRWRRPATGRV